jgi:hypothetical protein
MIFSFLVFLATAVAGPTMQLDTLANEADRVVVGEVLTSRTETDKQTSWTVTTVRVFETLRGASDPVVEVRLPGARLAQHDLVVHGQTQLIEGHEVLLFLRGDQVVGMGAGAFVVQDNKAWKNMHDWTYSDPSTIGPHANELYVSHEMEAVRSTIQ